MLILKKITLSAITLLALPGTIKGISDKGISDAEKIREWERLQLIEEKQNNMEEKPGNRAFEIRCNSMHEMRLHYKTNPFFSYHTLTYIAFYSAIGMVGAASLDFKQGRTQSLPSLVSGCLIGGAYGLITSRLHRPNIRIDAIKIKNDKPISFVTLSDPINFGQVGYINYLNE